MHRYSLNNRKNTLELIGQERQNLSLKTFFPRTFLLIQSSLWWYK